MNLLQLVSVFFKSKEKINRYKGMQDWTNDEIDTFIKQLKQVINWTKKLSANFDFTKYGFYGTVFRQTNPEINGIKLYNFESDYTTWSFDDYDKNLYETLLSVAINSREEINDLNLSDLDNLGRIICFQTCLTTHDGAPIVESQCFIDESDVPPIDTWFFLKNNYYHLGYLAEQTLFCWIPKQFEELMQQAINVEIFDSYSWLDENDKKMHNLIKSRV